MALAIIKTKSAKPLLFSLFLLSSSLLFLFLLFFSLVSVSFELIGTKKPAF